MVVVRVENLFGNCRLGTIIKIKYDEGKASFEKSRLVNTQYDDCKSL